MSLLQALLLALVALDLALIVAWVRMGPGRRSANAEGDVRGQAEPGRGQTPPSVGSRTRPRAISRAVPRAAATTTATAWAGLVVLPLTITGIGTAHHLEQAKTTEFCVSCHVMEPYGQSLLLDDGAAVPAVHFQDRLMARETACYSCHTTYTMFGDLRAKLAGARHVYVYYFGTVSDPIELYRPYENRECLQCHGQARSFVEGDLHADLLADLRSDQLSCLECHDMVHAVDRLAGQPAWQPADHWARILGPSGQAAAAREHGSRAPGGGQ